MPVKELHYDDVAGVARTGTPNGNRYRNSHNLFGRYENSAIQVAGLLVSDWKWNLTENIRVNCGQHTDLVFFSITESGFIHSDMGGLSHLDERQTSGGGLFYWSEGCRHQIKKGSTVTGLTITMKADYLASLVCNDGEWGEMVARKIENGEPFWFGDPGQKPTPVTKQQIRQIRECSDTGTGSLLLQSRVSELLFRQLENIKEAYSKPAPGNKPRPDETDKFYALRNYLEQHFLDEMTLAQLARISTLNEFKLKKGFKQLFGTTVFGFILQLRMEYAGKLLRDTGTSIAETASIAGYQHAHHFSSAFKKHFGVTPSDWIKYL